MAERPNRYWDAIVPHIYVDGATEAVDFYKRAFGAEELFRVIQPGGKILHAEISICGSVLMISDPTNKDLYAGPRSSGRTTASLHIFVDNNQALLQQAIAAGAEEIEPPTDMFYGDRISMVEDKAGVVWAISTHKEDVSPEEMERRMAAMAPKS